MALPQVRGLQPRAKLDHLASCHAGFVQDPESHQSS